MPPALLLYAKHSADKRINRICYLSLDGIKGSYLFLRGQFIPRQIAKQLGATEKPGLVYIEGTSAGAFAFPLVRQKQSKLAGAEYVPAKPVVKGRRRYEYGPWS